MKNLECIELLANKEKERRPKPSVFYFSNFRKIEAGTETQFKEFIKFIIDENNSFVLPVKIVLSLLLSMEEPGRIVGEVNSKRGEFVQIKLLDNSLSLVELNKVIIVGDRQKELVKMFSTLVHKKIIKA